MSPIRVGFIGLSTNSKGTSWATKAHLPYLQSEQGKKHYEIVALCNSSIDSAKKSIKEFKLPESTKSYDAPEDLAKDPNVDLIVNATGVELHHGLLMPVVRAGKNVYTELPLASNMEQMKELLETAESKKIKTVFGMQGQTSPVVKVLRQVIDQGKIGKVLSTTWVGFAGMLGDQPMPVGTKYFTDRKAGGNMMTVPFLHSFNYILYTLGELDTFHSILGNQRPSTKIIDPEQDGKPVETVEKDTPDQVLLQGRLETGALLSYHLRGGEPFVGQPGVVWSIYGEKGEIRVTNPMCMLDITHGGIEIKMQEFGEKEAQDIEVPEDDMTDLAHPSQNVGRIYEAYAEGKEGSYPDWKVAMKRHQLIEEIWRRSDAKE